MEPTPPWSHFSNHRKVILMILRLEKGNQDCHYTVIFFLTLFFSHLEPVGGKSNNLLRALVTAKYQEQQHKKSTFRNNNLLNKNFETSLQPKFSPTHQFIPKSGKTTENLKGTQPRFKDSPSPWLSWFPALMSLKEPCVKTQFSDHSLPKQLMSRTQTTDSPFPVGRTKDFQINKEDKSIQMIFRLIALSRMQHQCLFTFLIYFLYTRYLESQTLNVYSLGWRNV